MTELVQRFVALETEIANEKGDFALFALFLREDAPDTWDLVVAADWFRSSDKRMLNYIVQKLKSHFDSEELLKLSRIVPVEPSHPGVKAINRTVQVEHGNVEVLDSPFFGLPIKHAYIVTSRPVHVPA